MTSKTRIIDGLSFTGSPAFVASHWAYVLGTFLRFGRV
jgi:hypothetical protein